MLEEWKRFRGKYPEHMVEWCNHDEAMQALEEFKEVVVESLDSLALFEKEFISMGKKDHANLAITFKFLFKKLLTNHGFEGFGD